MKITLRRRLPAVIVCWALVVACMVFIFSMSAQPAKQSDKTSGGTIRLILKIFVRNFEELPEAEQQEMIDGLQHFVRKAAHFSIYAVLGALFLQAFLGHTNKKYIYPLSLFCSALFASTDELHQRFVPGRSGEIRDVLLDSCGALTGLLVSFLIISLIARIKNKRKNRDSK